MDPIQPEYLLGFKEKARASVVPAQRVKGVAGEMKIKRNQITESHAGEQVKP